MPSKNSGRNSETKPTSKVSRNRRQFVKALGTAGFGAFAVRNGISLAAAKRPEDIHPDDKHAISKDRYKRKGSDYRELVKNSKLFKARALGRDEVLIYVNRPFARKHLLDGTETVPKDASISARIASTDKGRELAARFETMNDQLDKEIDNSIRSYQPSGFTTQDTEVVQLGDDTTLDVASGQKDSGYFGIFGNRKVVVADKGFVYSETFIAPGAVGDAGCWGWTGREFTVGGSGSDTATIVANTSISGTVWSASNAASKVKSDFRIHNMTDDFTQETSIVDKTVANNIVGESDVIGDYNKAMTVNLQAGKRYRVVTSLKTAGSVGFAGGCTSDFGPNLDVNHLDREELHLQKFSIIF